MLIEPPIILNLQDVHFTDEQFNYLCQANPDWNLEETAQGELIIMPPTGGISGEREADLITDLAIWNRQTKLGKVFSSSTVFRLPNGGKRSPVELLKFPIDLNGEDILPNFVLSLPFEE